MKDVLLAAGAHPDPIDRAKWHTAPGLISINGQKFFNWNRHTGGGGAIDLAMHLNALGFQDARHWLVSHFPSSDMPAAVQPPTSTILRLPASAPRNLADVSRYLARRRLLPSGLLRTLINAGHLYADPYANAVFLLLGKKRNPVGAELRGTSTRSWRGMAPGSSKDRGYFRIGPQSYTGIVLCESAIDAISCLVLHPGHLCISTSGARPNPAWLPDLILPGLPLYCGFDADQTGERMAHAMTARHPDVQRLRPPQHDWNDSLLARL
ncbi:MAG: DUF3991 domain-containing protein [bacterium]|nr:DUF3991 domain-containing protein [bacterium]